MEKLESTLGTEIFLNIFVPERPAPAPQVRVEAGLVEITNRVNRVALGAAEFEECYEVNNFQPTRNAGDVIGHFSKERWLPRLSCRPESLPP